MTEEKTALKMINGREKRFPREFFTQKLTRICERLDESSEAAITWAHYYFKDSRTNVVSIDKIWVVGSYSRGALTCGDLDLVFSFSQKGDHLVPCKEVIKQLFGRVQYTSFFSGTPEENTSCVAFPDAVEIWSGPGCDWRKAIESIAPNPSAGRAPRPSDVIPLRLTQLNTHFEAIDKVVELINKGILESEFVPFTAEMLEPLQDNYKQTQIETRHYPPLGAATKKVLPAAFRVIDENNDIYRYETLERSELRCGPTLIRVGRPWLPDITQFDDLFLKEVALVPHLSSKGPNGVWFLRRGPNHPLVQAFSNKKAYVMCSEGKAAHIRNGYHNHLDTLSSLNLFTSKKEGQEYIDMRNEDIKLDSDKNELLELSGKALHDAISGNDFIQIDENWIALNDKASYIEEIDKQSAQHILSTLLNVDALAPAKRARKRPQSSPEGIAP